ncbi:MAG: hypothetical protein N2745_08455 [Syntrophorhabdaceae bacterium]|nr:hypothetical protein [Syntrophorhabdaceae bacterium]
MYKLFCDGDPVALGIEVPGGWNIEKLGEHLKTCKVCQAGLLNLLFPGGLTKEEKEAFEEGK